MKKETQYAILTHIDTKRNGTSEKIHYIYILLADFSNYNQTPITLGGTVRKGQAKSTGPPGLPKTAIVNCKGST
tara:strand:+ start:1368 stop:1589 length:222 start_codon:yes stop_codon:yes gene_type:complete